MSIKIAEFVKELRETARAFEPLTKANRPGGLKWNGAEYAINTDSEVIDPNPYALAWWVKLCTMADLIETQGAALTSAQIAYIRRELFGGMGSLNDVCFSVKEDGAKATDVNDCLNKKRTRLYEVFKALIPR